MPILVNVSCRLDTMDCNKSETPEDEREISLNETSIKRPLDVIDVIGGHGPWQFRLWIVFFAASLWNAVVVFSDLFLQSQMFCPQENATDIYYNAVSFPETNLSAASPETRNFVKQSTDPFQTDCNTTDCKANVTGSTHRIASKAFDNAECWSSQVEIFTKCSYLVACCLSGLLVYLTSDRFGRRPTALLSSLILTASSLATGWAYSAPVYLVLRSVTSLVTLNIYYITAFSLIECVHEDFKLLYFLTGHLGWGIAHFLLPAVAWLADDWKTFNILLTIISIIVSFLVWWCPESPSSFPKDGEHTRMRKVLKYAAFTNGYSTTHVDLISHNYHLHQESVSIKSKHDLGTLASVKDKIFFALYSFILFSISFTSAFLYFGTKWHTEWFKVASGRINFSFIGTTEVAAIIIVLFLTCFVAIKYLWAIVSAVLSLLLVIIYSRTNGGSSKTSAILYTLSIFFAAAAWTLILAKSFCHKMATANAKFSLAITGVAVFAGALAASAVVSHEDNPDSLLAFGVLHFIFAAMTLFLPEHFFGKV